MRATIKKEPIFLRTMSETTQEKPTKTLERKLMDITVFLMQAELIGSYQNKKKLYRQAIREHAKESKLLRETLNSGNTLHNTVKTYFDKALDDLPKTKWSIKGTYFDTEEYRLFNKDMNTIIITNTIKPWTYSFEGERKLTAIYAPCLVALSGTPIYFAAASFVAATPLVVIPLTGLSITAGVLSFARMSDRKDIKTILSLEKTTPLAQKIAYIDDKIAEYVR